MKEKKQINYAIATEGDLSEKFSAQLDPELVSFFVFFFYIHNFHCNPVIKQNGYHYEFYFTIFITSRTGGNSLVIVKYQICN